MKKGFYIVLEGPDGCGKTTQMKRLQASFTAANEAFVAVREPGATGIGKQIREILVTGHADKLDAITETLLFSADRHHTLKTLTQPALAGGQHVLSDRNYLSTVVFQGYGRRLSLSTLEEVTEFAMEGSKPDLIIVLDVPVEVSLSRKNAHLAATEHAAEAAENRFESIGSTFHERIRMGYLEESKRMPDICTVVDASQTPDAVHTAILTAINSRLGLKLA